MRNALLLASVLLASAPLVACSGGTTGSGTSSSSSSSSGGGGSSGTSGGGASGASGGGTAAALPATTFLFVKHVGDNRDHLMAYDTLTKQASLVSDLRGDGSEGWQIDGFAISHDRTKIAISSNYGPTSADNLTGLPTQRIWTLDTSGQSFVRLTPVFEKKNGSIRQIDVRNPMFTRDDAQVLYDYGTATSGGGYVAPWIVGVEGGKVPTLFPTSEPACSNVVMPATNPKTGEVLIEHSVCVNDDEEGYWLYPAGGSTTPKQLLRSAGMSLTGDTPRWAADGTAFLFTGTENQTGFRSLFIWGDANGGTFGKVLQGSETARIWNGTIAPDNGSIVTCVHEGPDGTLENLHVLDLTVDPPVDTALTTDGVSCDPRF